MMMIKLLVLSVALCFMSCHETEENGYCGNGIADGNEACDGADLSGNSCSTFGYKTGSLSCSQSCQFDFSGCSHRVCRGSEIIWVERLSEMFALR